jgi:DHA1 family tetracycline resistance protein-like MFS transporter
MTLQTAVILLTVFIDAMGIGLIVPVMPDLVQEVTGGSLAHAALWGGLLTTVFAVMQFLFGPMVGALSDRYGRKPVILISLVVLAADYVVMALAGSIWLLLAGRIVGGITAATQSTATAYIADITEPGKKAQAFGLIGAAFGLGFVAGPLIGGLLGELGTRAPFWAAAGLAAGNAVLGWFVLRETVTDTTRRAFSLRDANPFAAFRGLSALPGIGRGLWVYFLYQLAFFVYPAVWAYFCQARFGWDPAMIGLSLGLFGITMAAVQGGGIRLVLARLGPHGTVRAGLIFDIGIFGAMAFVGSGTLALILTPIAALGAVITPALQGLMSDAVGPTRQGTLQGVLTATNAVAMIVSPLLMTSVFAAATAEGGPILLPGAPFLVALVLVAVALMVFRAPERGKVAA